MMQAYRTLVVIALAVLITPTASQSTTTLNGYIFKLRPSASAADMTNLVNTFNAMEVESAASDTQQPIAPSAIVTNQYQKQVFHGVAGRFTRSFVDYVKKEGRSYVEYIEKDGMLYPDATFALYQQRGAPSWGLRRTSSWPVDITRPYYLTEPSGRGITVFVLDTGVMISHPDLSGRATYGANFATTEGPEDMYGHGTHVAGIIGGRAYGIAKNVNIKSVKVMAKNGGLYSWVIAGIQWAVQNGVRGKSILNMSLGGSQSQSVDDAIRAAYQAGFPIIAAAGNSAVNACDRTPSSAGDAVFAVGATDQTDRIASFSNYGSCVDAFAPGVAIPSLWNNGSYATLSGTSMSAPHTAGVAAMYMSMYDFTNRETEVYKWLVKYGRKGVVQGLTTTGNSRDTSPNVLLFNGCDPTHYYWWFNW